jgi:holliday junction DNA helicase RuvB
LEAQRVISGEAGTEDEAVERAIRPHRLEEYIGQAAVKAQLEIFVTAARQRGEDLLDWARPRSRISWPPSWA